MTEPPGAGNKKHYMVWTPFEQYIRPLTFDKLNEARAFAKERAEKNPGLAYYVMSAVKVFKADESGAVEEDLTD